MIFTRCKNTANTNVTGIVTDEITGEPIRNLNIGLLGSDYSLSSTSGTVGDKYTATTDNEGRYSFNFDRSKHSIWQLHCEVDKYEYDQIGSLADYIEIYFQNFKQR